ncbi:MAG: glycosyltransferase N-terminal domain-containing protein [Candidatus Zixiibacteriota bacterium]
MILLYRLLTFLLYLLVYPWARWRAARRDEVWRGRLGLDLPPHPVDLWMHAASVGEIRVISNLTAFLIKSKPDIRVHVTAVTRTGVETARAVLPRRVSVAVLPLDVLPLFTRVIGQLRPRIIVVAETEIWPNLIGAAARRGIPIILVNGRMTESSQGKYRFMARSLRRLLSKYERFFFKSEADRERFLSFGLDPSKGVVAGDMKFDAPVAMKSKEWVEEIRAELGVAMDRFLLVAGSTRPGEEAVLLAVFAELHKKYPQLRMVLAPRHLERLDEVRRLIDTTNIPSCLYGDGRACEAVSLVDRMGLLNDLYQAADLAFVGGTLVEIGGHNILEPVWARTPVLFGPHLDNVADAAEYIIANDYGAMVKDGEELKRTISDVIEKRRTFAEKVESDSGRSATALAGNYILKRLADV